MTKQMQRTWRGKDEFSPPMVELQNKIDPKNPESPYYGIVGNSDAVEYLMSVTLSALGYHNHWCGDDNIALVGPASVGKTMLAKRLASSTGLPFCELHPSRHRTPTDIFLEIERTLENYWFDVSGKKMNLSLTPINDGVYCPPPMHIFIDEVHGYQTNKNMTNALLTALEGDRVLRVKDLGEINCINIQWTIATTHRGALFGPLDTRFTKLQLQLYSQDEMAQIVKIHNDDLPVEACELASKYGGAFPREVLQFSKTMKRQKQMWNKSWEDAALDAAKLHGLDKWGMHEELVKILQVVGEFGCVSEKRLPQLVRMTKEELERFQYPQLLRSTPDRSPLMVMTHRGYSLTYEGGMELSKRDIDHKKEYAA